MQVMRAGFPAFAESLTVDPQPAAIADGPSTGKGFAARAAALPDHASLALGRR
jgi:hypothetical protein